LRSKQNLKDQDKGVWDHGPINPSNFKKQWSYRVINVISARAAKNSRLIISPYFNLRPQGQEQRPPQTIDDLIIQRENEREFAACKYWLTGLAPQDLISSSCNRVSICSLLNTIFHIEINKNEREKFFSSSRSNSRFLCKCLPLFFCLKLGFLEMFRLFLCFDQLTLFGIDIASYTNGLTNNGDVNEKFPD
jgi:hypothetical protein